MPFPIQLNFAIPNLFANQPLNITLNSPLTILVGPNGSGKTQFLKSLRNQLAIHANDRKIRYLSAGRLSFLETYRSNQVGNGGDSAENANFGSGDYTFYRHASETAYGDFQTLNVRPDIQIKIRERLSKLFKRDFIFSWSRGSLKVQFNKAGMADYYSSANEASGLLHLVALLAAIYDDEVGTLLIDEPEISLHPQLQSFIFRELEKSAGDNSIRNKKTIVISTHSTEFLSVRNPKDICNLIFFNNTLTRPSQILPQAGELQNRKLKSLLTRLGLNQKLAFFSSSPLLVEGPSDQTICTALENKLDIYLGAAGSQIVPVSGKGQIPIVNRFFRLIGKNPVIITDIDSLSDNLDLINSLQFSQETTVKANEHGSASVHIMASAVNSDYSSLITNNWSDIAALAEITFICTNRNTADNEMIYKKRAGLVTILNTANDIIQALNNGVQWLAIKTRYIALLDLLEYGGCFILRKGYIEEYYSFANKNMGKDKVELAVDEMIGIEDSVDLVHVRNTYSDIIKGLKFAAKSPEIDEAGALSDLVLAAVTPAISRLNKNSTNQDVEAIAKQMLNERSAIFDLSVEHDGEDVLLVINNKSVILDVEGFPLKFRSSSNPIEVVKAHIKRK